MPDQYHHMATQYGEWGQKFQELLDLYQLDLSVADSARAWNVYLMRHRGPHPVEYHTWVYENAKLAATTAGVSNTADFLAYFDQWVTQRVLADPTIVRKAYWECYG